jgi:hypothetical protein
MSRVSLPAALRSSRQKLGNPRDVLHDENRAAKSAAALRQAAAGVSMPPAEDPITTALPVFVLMR